MEPTWDDVAAAVSRLDDHEFPIVELSCTEHDDDEALLVIGGRGRYALTQSVPGWQFSDPSRPDREVRLWTSDQGYFCTEREIITDLGLVLRIVEEFYRTGSYDGLDRFAGVADDSEVTP
ncbi:Imm1 family immunity protein [Sanguibacter suaedae]|uniref:Imm1 family immunity protein n=1 Tax=Sanguibacter suaedae TaxID=2795737 RepID=UPI0018E6BF7D|nr:Imm1 family immunity protein [Sanguibacter suaedae]